MTTKTKILISAAVFSAATVVGMGAASTVGAFGWGGQNRSSLMATLSQKLGIDQSKLEKAFDEMRSDKQQQMLKTFEAKLDEAVKAGKLTEAKKKLILDKKSEYMEARQKMSENWQNMTPAQRRAEAEKHRTEMREWAEKNGIPSDFLFGGMGMMGAKGMGMRRW